MNDKCNLIVFSNDAYNTIIEESFAMNPIETGGILLGHVIDGGNWLVMKVIPPGINTVNTEAYFEYDKDYINYTIAKVAHIYKYPLDILGLWHRHPGSMDYFSSTDNKANKDFASKDEKGAISGLVNIDPVFRLTMYHVDLENPQLYTKAEVEVGDDLIPEEFFELKYFNSSESNLHPSLDNNTSTNQRRVHSHRNNGQRNNIVSPSGTRNEGASQYTHSEEGEFPRDIVCDIRNSLKKNSRLLRLVLFGTMITVAIFSYKFAWDGIKSCYSYLFSQNRIETNNTPQKTITETFIVLLSQQNTLQLDGVIMCETNSYKVIKWNNNIEELYKKLEESGSENNEKTGSENNETADSKNNETDSKNNEKTDLKNASNEQ